MKCIRITPRFLPPLRNHEALRFALAVAIFLLVALACSWLADTVSFYYLSRSYVDEIADAFDFSKHLAKAISIVVFVLLLFFIKKGRERGRGRLIGVGGVVALLVAHSLLLWQGTKLALFDRSGKATKCFVLTSAGEVRYSEHFGVDPITGRECQAVTAQIRDRLELYKNGRRPELLGDNVAEFFESRTAAPLVWYARTGSGDIELFNLMGFHPRTREELKPVTPEIVSEFNSQRAQRWHRAERKQRPPKPVDPDVYPAFDPATGAGRIWYHTDEAGDFEFFDADGFHPRTGQPLKPADRSVLSAWRKMRADQQLKQQQDSERKAREEREAAERSLRETQIAEERARATALAEQQALAAESERRDAETRREKALQAAALCDQLAANPSDTRRTKDVPGVRYNDLKQQARSAVEACGAAAGEFPSALNYKYQQARALSVDDPDAAMEILQQLASQKYAAAHDNIASLLLRSGDTHGAILWLRAGVKVNDPDSMVTLVDLIDRGVLFGAQSRDNKRTAFSEGGSSRSCWREAGG